MQGPVKPIPDGYHTLTPYLIVRGGFEALAFYAAAFGARELLRLGAPGGKLGHAELQIGDSRVMLADEFPDMDARSPRSFGGTPARMMLYVEDCDALFARAVAAGAKVIRPLADQFYGDRVGGLEDPFGHVWFVATHKEDLTPEELAKRAAAAHG
ncbi:MAG: VOC family protein [Planctomycetes bacterium]|nr:VOC family protein [Planctomycetota bacterium]